MLNERIAFLKIAGLGGVLGLAAMLSGNPHLTTAQATELSFVALLREADLTNGMQNTRSSYEPLHKCLVAESIETAVLSLRVPCSSSQRLATALLRLADANGPLTHSSGLIYTHAELAQLIGASREIFTRLMKKLQRRG